MIWLEGRGESQNCNMGKHLGRAEEVSHSSNVRVEGAEGALLVALNPLCLSDELDVSGPFTRRGHSCVDRDRRKGKGQSNDHLLRARVIPIYISD